MPDTQTPAPVSSPSSIAEALPPYVQKSVSDIVNNVTFKFPDIIEGSAPSASVAPPAAAPAPSTTAPQPHGRWAYVKPGMHTYDLRKEDQAYLQQVLADTDQAYVRDQVKKYGIDSLIGPGTNRYLADRGVVKDRSGTLDIAKLEKFDNDYKLANPGKYAEAQKHYPTGFVAQPSSTPQHSNTSAASTKAPQAGHLLAEYPHGFIRYIQQLLVDGHYLPNTTEMNGIADAKTIAAAKTAGFADQKGVLTDKGFKLIPEDLHTAPHAYLNAMSKEQILELQNALAEKNLLSKGKITGKADPETIEAAKKAGVLDSQNKFNSLGLKNLESRAGQDPNLHIVCRTDVDDKNATCPDVAPSHPTIGSVSPSPVPAVPNGAAKGPSK